jgi:hypothetical protein
VFVDFWTTFSEFFYFSVSGYFFGYSSIFDCFATDFSTVFGTGAFGASIFGFVTTTFSDFGTGHTGLACFSIIFGLGWSDFSSSFSYF